MRWKWEASNFFQWQIDKVTQSHRENQAMHTHEPIKTADRPRWPQRTRGYGMVCAYGQN